MKSLKIGILGLGTVGAGLVELVSNGGALGKAVEITGISARDKNKFRPFDVSKYQWFDDAIQMAQSDEIDVLVELIGGHDGLAKDAVCAALNAKKHVVTANKALLAYHGEELAALASANGVEIRYEAAVAGGIPIVKALREGLAANQVEAVYGVLNGTSNFILTTMAKTGRAFDDVLKEAQALGYAEADPTLDISGGDAGHKLSILSALAFSGAPDFASLELEGIENIIPDDLETAKFFGYSIKLIASASVVNSKLRQSVKPTLVRLDNPLASLDGATNGVLVKANPVGTISFIGAGAGAGPTASAVAADLLDLAHGDKRPAFSGPWLGGKPIQEGAKDELVSKFYVRFKVSDKPGVIAKISETLARHQVSIESFLQKPPKAPDDALIVLTTQKCGENILIDALMELSNFDEFVEKPYFMPIMI